MAWMTRPIRLDVLGRNQGAGCDVWVDDGDVLARVGMGWQMARRKDGIDKAAAPSRMIAPCDSQYNGRRVARGQPAEIKANDVVAHARRGWVLVDDDRPEIGDES